MKPSVAEAAATAEPAVTKIDDSEPTVPKIDDGAPLPGRHLVFAIVATTLVMSSLDQNIVATALPAMQHDLHARLNWSSWTITIYALGQIIVMPIAGVLSQQFGRKQIFVTGLILFTVSSLLCGLSTNIYELVGLRALQSIGGGSFVPSASGIVADQYGSGRDRALGLFSSIFPIGGATGPILGGIFVTYWSWRGIFLVNVPVGIVVLILTIKFVPASARKAGGRIDFIGIALLGGLILSAMYGVTALGSSTSLADPRFFIFEALAIMFGYFFLRHLRRTPTPFIAPRLLYGKGFAIINSINLLYGAAAIGFSALVPVYAEDRYHIRSLSAGTLLTARAIAMIVFAGSAVLLLRRYGYRRPMYAGFAIMGGGLALIALYPVGSITPYLWLGIGAAVTGIGMGICQPAANNAMMQLAPDQVAAVAGLRGMIRQSGAIISVSLVSALAARSADPGITLAHVFLVFAALLLLAVPLVRRVPEHRGGW